MKKYIQVSLSLRDKLKLLFFNIILEDQLIIQSNNPTQPVQQPVQQQPQEQKETESQNINNSDDKDFSVPFFDFDQDDKKSNF